MVVHVATSAVAFGVVGLATESVAADSCLGMVEQRPVAFIMAHLALSLEALPAIKDPIFRRIVPITWQVIIHGHQVCIPVYLLLAVAGECRQ